MLRFRVKCNRLSDVEPSASGASNDDHGGKSIVRWFAQLPTKPYLEVLIFPFFLPEHEL